MHFQATDVVATVAKKSLSFIENTTFILKDEFKNCVIQMY